MYLIDCLFCSALSLATPPSSALEPSSFPSSIFLSLSTFYFVPVPTGFFIFSSSAYVISTCPLYLPLTLVSILSASVGDIPPFSLILYATTTSEVVKLSWCCPAVYDTALPQPPPPPPPLPKGEAVQCTYTSWCLTAVHPLLMQLWMASLLQASYTLDSIRPNYTLDGVCSKYTFYSVRPKYNLEAVGVNCTFEAVGTLHARLYSHLGSYPCLYFYYFRLSVCPPWSSRLHLPVTSPHRPCPCCPPFLRTLHA